MNLHFIPDPCSTTVCTVCLACIDSGTGEVNSPCRTSPLVLGYLTNRSADSLIPNTSAPSRYMSFPNCLLSLKNCCYVCYSFLLISNKLCDLSLLHWLIETALYVKLLMWANPLLRQVGCVWALEISTFLGPKGNSPNGSMVIHKAPKSLDFQGPTPSHLPS